MKRSFALILAVLGALCGASNHFQVARAADKHPFGLDDFAALRGASATSISPDGKQVLYNVFWNGTSGPAFKEEWHLVDISGANDRKLDLPEQFNPIGFMKEGKSLYGIMPVADLPQLAIVPLTSGQPTQILALPSGVRGARISPDGTRFAVLADPRQKIRSRKYTRLSRTIRRVCMSSPRLERADRGGARSSRTSSTKRGRSMGRKSQC